jgi:hypothetical protein
MMDEINQTKAEEMSSAHAAVAAADFARANIERYLQLHSGASAKFVMKIADPSAHYVMKIADPSAHYVMKIADDALAGISRIVDDSATLAAVTLQAFVDSRKAR